MLKIFAAASAVALATALPWLVSSYILYQLTMALVWSIAILGINLVTGYSGLISVASALFVALGAYTSALLVVDHGFHWLQTIPPAALLTFALGYVMGVPALRLKGFYLTTLTLAVTLALGPLVKRFDGLTYGAAGVVVPRAKAPDWLPLASSQWRYLLTLAVAILCFVAVRGLVSGAIGRALVAMRDGEVVAECNGISTTRAKTLAFAFSSALAGIAGALYAGNVGLVTPDEFSVFLSIDLLAAAVVGGIATVGGAIVGALFLVFVPVYIGEVSQAMIGIVFGAVLIFVILLMPSGIVGLAREKFTKEPAGWALFRRAVAGRPVRS